VSVVTAAGGTPNAEDGSDVAAVLLTDAATGMPCTSSLNCQCAADVTWLKPNVITSACPLTWLATTASLVSDCPPAYVRPEQVR
jgi:hypothetical protein